MDLISGFGLIGVILVVSALVAGLVDRGPISFPMIFLGLGLLAGQSPGLLEVDPHSPALEVIATLTLALVLFMDALTLDGGRSRKDWLVPALVLGPGTFAVIAAVAAAAHLLLNLPLVLALILGAVLASTDAVVLRDVVRDERVPRPVRRVLSVEAGTNDIIVLPLILILIALSGAGSAPQGFTDWSRLGFQIFVVGPAIGFVVGGAGSWLLARADARFTIRREYQALYGVGLVLTAYAGAVAAGGDGFLAAFFAGIAITVLDQALCDCFLELGDAVAEMSMLLAFVLFGALMADQLRLVPTAATLTLAAFTIFVARPLAMLAILSLRTAALSRTARAFIAWFGPRGLNSLLFALLVVQADVPRAEFLLAAVGMVVLVSVVAHGASATPLAAWYGRRVATETLAEERVGTATALFGRQAPDNVVRVTPDELKGLLDGQEAPTLVDVRSRSSYDKDAVHIPGDVRVLPDSVGEWAAKQLRDQPYVMYCT
ncbi:MAG: cation:proton antiporter domain-containing protein [Actinomycetota bacterium]